jgi:hypothetical protein
VWYPRRSPFTTPREVFGGNQLPRRRAVETSVLSLKSNIGSGLVFGGRSHSGAPSIDLRLLLSRPAAHRREVPYTRKVTTAFSDASRRFAYVSRERRPA